MTKRFWLGLLPALFLAAASAGPAGAAWVPHYYVFDRITWSPDGSALAVIGRYHDGETGESFEDTLLVDVKTGAMQCLSPSVTSFVMSRSGDRMLFRGRWGLHEHDFETGVTRQIFSQGALKPSSIVQYSYGRDDASAVCLQCSEEDPEQNAVLEYAFDGSDPVALFTDSHCSASLMNFWQKRRRGVDPEPSLVPALKRAVVVPGFPGTFHAIKKGLTPGLAVFANGDAGTDTLCLGCSSTFVSWPRSGSSVLVADGPDDSRDRTTPGRLWLVGPSREPIDLAGGRFVLASWRDSTHALVLARPGVLWSVDTETARARPLDFSLVPDWLRLRRLETPPVWTVVFPRAVMANGDSARAASLWARRLDVEGYAADSLDAGGVRLSLGVFPDSAAAASAAGRIRGASPPFATSGAFVERRNPGAMLGSFDFGRLKSPDGRTTAFLRSHPHLFQPLTATEVWLEPAGGGRRRLLIEAEATW